MPTPLFNSQTAVKYARMSHATRKAKMIEYAALKEAAIANAIQPLPVPVPAVPVVMIDDRTRDVLNMLKEQISMTREALLVDKLPPKDRAQLLNSLDRLIERERVLRQIPGPSNLRPSQPTKQRRQAAIAPPNTSANAPVIDIAPIATQDSK